MTSLPVSRRLLSFAPRVFSSTLHPPILISHVALSLSESLLMINVWKFRDKRCRYRQEDLSSLIHYTCLYNLEGRQPTLAGNYFSVKVRKVSVMLGNHYHPLTFHFKIYTEKSLSHIEKTIIHT